VKGVTENAEFKREQSWPTLRYFDTPGSERLKKALKNLGHSKQSPK
jgi:hypothetical protein